MFFLKSIPANIRYYWRQSLAIYLLDCLFLGLAMIILGLIRLEQHNLTQLKSQLAHFTAAEKVAAGYPVKNLLHANQIVLGRYQIAYYLLLIVGVISTVIISWVAFKILARDIETFLSANWTRTKVTLYYGLTALCLLFFAILTVSLLLLIVNQPFWRGLEAVNHYWHQPLETMQKAPKTLNPLFKNHLTDFSSHSLLNPTLHNNGKQTLTNQIFGQLWQAVISLGVPVLIISGIQVSRFKKKYVRGESVC